MKKQTLLASALWLLSACSGDFFYGKSNFPEPRALETQAAEASVQVLWQHALGEGVADLQLALKPAAMGGMVFAVSRDGHLFGFDAATGAVQLKRDLGNHITAGVAAFDGLLLVGTENGSLLALNAQTGLPEWQAMLSSQAVAVPVVGASGVLAVRTLDGGINAFNVRTGEKLWHYQSASPALSMRGQSAPVVSGGVVMVTTDSGRLLLLDEDNGVPLVEERIAIGQGNNRPQRMVDMDATPQLLGDYLFASAYQYGVMGFDIRAGKALWQQDLTSALHDFAIVGQEVLALADHHSNLYGLSLRDGRPMWHVTELEGRKVSPVVAWGRSEMAVIDFEGYLHRFDALSGSWLGYQKVADEGANAAPLVVGDKLIWQLNNGRLVALSR